MHKLWIGLDGALCMFVRFNADLGIGSDGRRENMAVWMKLDPEGKGKLKRKHAVHSRGRTDEQAS